MTFTDLYEDWITQAHQLLDSGRHPPRLWQQPLARPRLPRSAMPSSERANSAITDPRLAWFPRSVRPTSRP